MWWQVAIYKAHTSHTLPGPWRHSKRKLRMWEDAALYKQLMITFLSLTYFYSYKNLFFSHWYRSFYDKSLASRSSSILNINWMLMTFPDEDGRERFLYQGHCRAHCPREFYPDREQYICLPCIANCEICVDSNICAKCKEAYKVESGLCLPVPCGVGKRFVCIYAASVLCFCHEHGTRIAELRVGRSQVNWFVR